MAKAQMVLDSLTPRVNSVVVKFHFSYKAGYAIRKNESIRLYYDHTSSVTGSDAYVTIPIILESDSPSNYNTVYNSSVGYIVTYEWTRPNNQSYTKYWFQLRMQLYVSPNAAQQVPVTPYKKWTTYRNPKNPSVTELTSAGSVQPLFSVKQYTNKHDVTEDGETYSVWDTDWIDFTDCITFPSYDVNYEDINEDWDDANYTTHRIRVRKRVTGKFSMLFDSLARYNQFMQLLKWSRERNGNGEAYVELRMQVNNEVNEYSNTYSSFATDRCMEEEGLFFIKIDSNPWVIPKVGHYNQYSPINVTVQQA